MRIYFLSLLLIAFATPALAQMTSSDAPVEISADTSLEWDRTKKTYTARDNAIAKQGNFQVASQTLTAYYKDDAGQTDIHEMIARDNVVISSPPYEAFGDHAVYDVHKNHATLTGKNLKITTPTDLLTARDKIEFFGAENRMVATGDAVAVRGTDRLNADVMSGFFSEGADKKMALTKITGNGNVSIKTAKETIHGDQGVYDIPAQKAVLTGKVRILQGENWLEGTRATVDLQTGISQLFAEGNAATQGRVKGIFYPKSKTGAKPAEPGQTPPPQGQ